MAEVKSSRLYMDKGIGLDEVIIAALRNWQAGLWTAVPGIVESYDKDRETVVVQAAVRCRRTTQTGDTLWLDIPLLQDVPVVFPGGGGFTLTFPIAQGDECLVVFSSRCIDGWWLLGEVQNPPLLRMHDLSDGFAIIGPRSQPRTHAPACSGTTTQLRSDDGAVYIELAAGHVANIVAPGGLNITGPVVINGNVATTGTLENNGKAVGSTHLHTGVTAGGANSGPPA